MPVSHKAPSAQTTTAKRALLRRMLTVYGRKPVLEALRDSQLDCRTLHLAVSNRDDAAIREMRELASQRGLELRQHTRQELSRISRNGRQDQGAAIDVLCPHFQELEAFLAALPPERPARLLALDGVTNPQNVGMVVRTARAAGIDGLLYADRGNPALGPLVIKASAGTLYQAPILRCPAIPEAAAQCVRAGFTLYTLEAGAERCLFSSPIAARSLFVLGGETEGLSTALRALPHTGLSIPMQAGVESLNVAVSAALVCYAGRLSSLA